MNISTMRTLVTNGWNIANRRTLAKIIGHEEMQKLSNAYKHLRVSDEFPSLNRSKHTTWIPSEDITLLKSGEDLRLKFSTYIDELYAPKPNHFLENDEITLDSIIKTIKSFETKAVSMIKRAKRLSSSSLSSKTVEKLYTSKYTPIRRITEDGFNVTTLIDKKTSKPVEAYVKKVDRPDNYEEYRIFVKNSTGEYELVGKRTLIVDRENRKITDGWMESDISTDKYAGVGLRCQQIGVERMLQEKLDYVELSAAAQAFPFHYKCGFRAVPTETPTSTAEINLLIATWSELANISKTKLRKAIVTRKDGENIILDSRTFENFRKLLHQKNNLKYVDGDTTMALTGDALQKWIERAKMQPIFI